VGLLYVKKRTKFVPYVIGGSQEHGYRAGTENVPYIVGFGRAAELAMEHLTEENTRVRSMRDRLEATVFKTIPNTARNGAKEPRLPNTANLSFAHVEAEAILLLLDRLGICASSGSACTTGSIEPSHVLTAMDVKRPLAKGSIRFSFGIYNTDEDVDYVLEHLPGVIQKLRACSTAKSETNYNMTQQAFAITSSGTRVGRIDSRANVQPIIFFSAASDTAYSISGNLTVSDPGSSGKFGELTATLIDVDSSEVLYNSHQGSFGVVNLVLQLGGLAGNSENELQGSATGTLLAGHRYKLNFGSSIYAANSGDPASFTGNFNITFGNVAVNNPPICNAGTAQVKEAEGALTAVQLDGSLSTDPDGDPLEFEWSVAADSGATISDASSAVTTGYFPVGPTLVTLTVSDGKGGISVCDVLITIQDTTPPVVVCTTDKISLWPADYSMQSVLITVQASDTVASPESLSVQCTISSNEPDNTTTDGTRIGDVAGQDGYTSPVPISLTYNPTTKQFSAVTTLRAERVGDQSGRVYSILCHVTDEAGNTSTASCVVLVPHDRRRK
jgi:hypothetical protein